MQQTLMAMKLLIAKSYAEANALTSRLRKFFCFALPRFSSAQRRAALRFNFDRKLLS
jgi:hypothetical protein